jgi:hypothetical protein
LHLLEEVLEEGQAEPQDTSSGGEENGVLSRDINNGMPLAIESSAVNPSDEGVTPPALQHNHQVVASFLIEVQVE